MRIQTHKRKTSRGSAKGVEGSDTLSEARLWELAGLITDILGTKSETNMRSGLLLHQRSVLSPDTMFLNGGACVWKASHSRTALLWAITTGREEHSEPDAAAVSIKAKWGVVGWGGTELLERWTPLSFLHLDQSPLLHVCMRLLLNQNVQIMVERGQPFRSLKKISKRTCGLGKAMLPSSALKSREAVSF